MGSVSEQTVREEGGSTSEFRAVGEGVRRHTGALGGAAAAGAGAGLSSVSTGAHPQSGVHKVRAMKATHVSPEGRETYRVA